MLKNKLDIAKLLAKKIINTTSSQEENAINDWKTDKNNKKLYQILLKKQKVQEDLNLFNKFDSKKSWRTVLSSIDTRKTQHLKHRTFLLGIAASLVTLLTITFLLYNKVITDPKSEKKPLSNTIKPGSDKAILKLEDGSVFELSDNQNGLYSTGDSLHLNKDKFIYLGGLKTDKVQSLSIFVPRGGQYKIILPDGTKVWLNSASSIIYPSRFDESSRTVSIQGEAFFEVTKQKRENRAIPFYVKTSKQIIEVLGTSFDIRTYDSNSPSLTTLVEGSVRVTSPLYPELEIMLHPGEQSYITNHTNGKRKVDIAEVTAWKDGFFMFKDMPLESLLADVERWYDVQFIYSNTRVKTERFEGMIPRYANVSELLNILQNTGKVSFEITNHTIVVK